MIIIKNRTIIIIIINLMELMKIKINHYYPTLLQKKFRGLNKESYKKKKLKIIKKTYTLNNVIIKNPIK